MKEIEEYIPVALRKDFRKEYTIIDLAAEYPGYRDDIPYAIVTELSEDEFEAAFGKEIEMYRPFVILTKDMYKAIVMSGLNNERERWRDIMLHDPFALESSALLLVDEMSSPARICESIFTMECIFAKMRKLPNSAGIRIYKRYVIGYSSREIAEQEGTTFDEVRKCIYRAKPEVHDIFVELGVVA